MHTVFLDFEASSLRKHGIPIEVGWVFDTGEEESYLIKPAPDWTDWSDEAQRIHGIPRERLIAEGTPHDEVARRMLAVLDGHALYASAPSWDGQWLSKLLRASGLPRHALRLNDTDLAQKKAIKAVLQSEGLEPEVLKPEVLARIANEILAGLKRDTAEAGPPAHRALDDARRERSLWMEAQDRARAMAGRFKPPICNP